MELDEQTTEATADRDIALALKLRGLTPQTTDAAVTVNKDVYAVCLVLLEGHQFVIFEEALVRSGHRKNRHLVQWPAIKAELQEHFKGRTLLSVSRSTFRELIHAKFGPLHVLTHVKEYLDKGNGNETAGFGFVNWNNRNAERHITQREHVATGFQNAASQLRTERAESAAAEQRLRLPATQEE